MPGWFEGKTLFKGSASGPPAALQGIRWAAPHELIIEYCIRGESEERRWRDVVITYEEACPNF